MTGAASYLWFRVDDRLLHGQVTLGWGRHLDPDVYLLADDELAADPTSAAIFQLAAPPGVQVELGDVASIAEREPSARTFLVVRSIAAAARLLHAGVPGPVNLGGLHRHGAAEPYLPYLYLESEERDLLRRLCDEGFTFVVQDLPENPPRDLEALLDAGPDPGRS